MIDVVVSIGVIVGAIEYSFLIISSVINSSESKLTRTIPANTIATTGRMTPVLRFSVPHQVIIC